MAVIAPAFYALILSLAGLRAEAGGLNLRHCCNTYTPDRVPQANQIKIIPNYFQIDSIGQFQRLLNGKAVFVDLWALWCEPCFTEFKFSKALCRHLNSGGIALLYISIDKDLRDSIWRQTIHHYKLYGSQIRANKKLQGNIEMLIWGAKDAYSIPHYLFI